MKTAKQLLDLLPEKQRKEILKYCKGFIKYESLRELIEQSFDWEKTDEGRNYWQHVSMWYTYDYLIFLCKCYGGRICKVEPEMGMLIDQAKASGRICDDLIWNPSPDFLRKAPEELISFFFPLNPIEICKN